MVKHCAHYFEALVVIAAGSIHRCQIKKAFLAENKLDYFILARLEEERFETTSARMADKATLYPAARHPGFDWPSADAGRCESVSRR